MAKLPQIKDLVTWQQAELVMQPAFIRIVDHIRQNLESCAWRESYQEITEPSPQYLLCLQLQDQQVQVDLWQLCYEICFKNYSPEKDDQEVEIDRSLIDSQGDIDWENLDRKAKILVNAVFTSLPLVPEIAGDDRSQV